MSAMLVGSVTARTPRGARPASLWVGTTGPLLVPDPDALDDVAHGSEVRVVYHAESGGRLVVDVLIPSRWLARRGHPVHAA